MNRHASEQMRMDDLDPEIAAVTNAGHVRAAAKLSSQALNDWHRILNHWSDAGQVFTADDMREQLDLAQIPLSSRGTLMRNAHSAGLVRWVGYYRSRHPSTHGKAISLWISPHTKVAP